MQSSNIEHEHAVLLLFKVPLALVFVSRAAASLVMVALVGGGHERGSKASLRTATILLIVHAVEFVVAATALFTFQTLWSMAQSQNTVVHVSSSSLYSWLTIVILQLSATFYECAILMTDGLNNVIVPETHMVKNAAMGITLINIDLSHKAYVLVAAALLLLLAVQVSARQLHMTWAALATWLTKLTAEVTISAAILEQQSALLAWFVPEPLHASRWFEVFVLFWILAVAAIIKGLWTAVSSKRKLAIPCTYIASDALLLFVVGLVLIVCAAVRSN